MLRNRSLRKLFLYVDGKLAGQPSEDQFTIPLNNDRPLTIGRWENYDYPTYFSGVVDEVRLWSPKLISVINVQPTLLDFGKVKVGSSDTLLLNVSNSGFRGPLRISSVTSGNPRFNAPSGPLPAGESITIPIWYTPLASITDTGVVIITSNDPIVPFLDIRVRGKGFAFAAEPIIDKVTMVPFTYNQLRIRWFRSIYDSMGVTDPVTEYSLWRSLPGAEPSAGRSHVDPYGLPSSALTGTVWEFITTVPALGFDAYSCLVPAVVDYTYNYTSNVLMVAARTKNLLVFLSLPDTVQLNPGYVTGIGGTETRQAVNELSLSQNYPNPFNPTTTILYELPRTSQVTLTVYDLLGREVATLVNGVEEPGHKSVEFNATNLAGGIYFYRITAGDHVLTRKLVYLK
jgi:hypothetical protein